MSPGTQTGWVSMTSATVTPSRRSEKRLETTAPVADWPRNQPMRIHQIPLPASPRTSRKTPSPMRM